MTSVTKERPPSKATRDKYLWVEKHLSDITLPQDIIFAHKKELLINEESVLIDDAPHFLLHPCLKGKVIGYRRKYNQTITSIPFIEKWSLRRSIASILLL